MEDLKSEVYDETIKYFKENNLKPSENLDFIHFRISSPNLSLEQSLVAFNHTDDK